MKTISSLGLLAALATTPFVGAVNGRQPETSKPVVEIVTALEEQKYLITEVSMDDGAWEVEAYRDDVAYELQIDPRTGEIVSEHRDDAESRPPKNALPLSKVIVSVEKAGYLGIDEVSFERRSWEVEAQRDRTKRELRVDPATAEVISDRVDD